MKKPINKHKSHQKTTNLSTDRENEHHTHVQVFRNIVRVPYIVRYATFYSHKALPSDSSEGKETRIHEQASDHSLALSPNDHSLAVSESKFKSTVCRCASASKSLGIAGASA